MDNPTLAIVEQLNKEYDNIVITIDHAQERLAPILKDPEPSPECNVDTSDPNASPLRSSLNNLTKKLIQINNTLSDLIKRIDL